MLPNFAMSSSIYTFMQYFFGIFEHISNYRLSEYPLKNNNHLCYYLSDKVEAEQSIGCRPK